ncbi:MAG TPA: relaxase/mobilization nuclease domain-containing protein [Allocoleopsis sp.]
MKGRLSFDHSQYRWKGYDLAAWVTQKLTKLLGTRYVILSLAPGENQTPQQWLQIAHEWRKGMYQEEVKRQTANGISSPEATPSYQNFPFVIWSHQDRKHPHIHMLISTIDWKGGVVSQSWNYPRSEAVCRAIEQKFDLKPVYRSGSAEHIVSKASKFPQHSEHDFLRWAIGDAATGEAVDLATFLERLRHEGVEPQLCLNRNGSVKGIKYRFSEESNWINGSDLGQQYSYRGLEKHLKVALAPAEAVLSVTSQGRYKRLLKKLLNTSGEEVTGNWKRLCWSSLR